MKKQIRHRSIKALHGSEELKLSYRLPKSRGESFILHSECLEGYARSDRAPSKNGKRDFKNENRVLRNSIGGNRINNMCTISAQMFISDSEKEIIKLPAGPDKAKRAFCRQLSEFEKNEITQYKEIYFFSKSEKENACEFDDFKHNLLLYRGCHIAYRYEVKDLLGSGSFSQVYKAFDWKSKRDIALKVIRNKEKLSAQAEIEISILNFIKPQTDSLAFPKILSSFTFRGHTCIAFELIGPPLCCKSLPSTLTHSYISSILTCLSFLHRNNIIHCDLKPSNLLVSDAKLFLIDFGTSCFKSCQVFRYIQSRSYRAPEVMLRMKYTEKIDMWSFGCVLCEMCTGEVLFTGQSESEVISEIVAVIGPPPMEVYKTMKVSVEKLRGLKSILLGCDPVFVKLVSECLQWDPTKRISSLEALEYLAENHV